MTGYIERLREWVMARLEGGPVDPVDSYHENFNEVRAAWLDLVGGGRRGTFTVWEDGRFHVDIGSDADIEDEFVRYGTLSIDATNLAQELDYAISFMKKQ